jgi:hypothetical protein
MDCPEFPAREVHVEVLDSIPCQDGNSITFLDSAVPQPMGETVRTVVHLAERQAQLRRLAAIDDRCLVWAIDLSPA